MRITYLCQARNTLDQLVSFNLEYSKGHVALFDWAEAQGTPLVSAIPITTAPVLLERRKQ